MGMGSLTKNMSVFTFVCPPVRPRHRLIHRIFKSLLAGVVQESPPRTNCLASQEHTLTVTLASILPTCVTSVSPFPLITHLTFDPKADYVFPGGPIATLTTASGSDGNNGTSTSIPPSSTRKPTSTTSVVSPAVPTGTGSPATNGSSNRSLKNKRSLLKRSNWKNRRSESTRPHVEQMR